MTFKYIPLLLFIVAACRPIKKNQLQATLDSIDNISLSASQQLKLILKADTMAIAAGNANVQYALHTKAGELYLHMDSAAAAKIHFAIAVQLAGKRDRAAALNNMGIAYDEMFETDSALKFYHEAAHLFSITHDSSSLAQAVVNMGTLYKNKGNPTEAVVTITQAANILEQTGDTIALSAAYTTLGNTMKAMNQYDKALFYHEKSLAISQSANDSIGIASAFNNIGNVYRYQKKYISSLDCYFKALAIKEKTGNRKTIANTIDNIATTYLDQQQYAQAKVYFEKALSIRKDIADTDGILTTMNRLSRLFIEMNDLTSAGSLAKEAEKMAMDLGYLKEQIDNNEVLTEMYRREGQYKIALDYSLRNLRLKDSLFNINIAKATAESETRFRTVEKEHQLVFINQLKNQQAHTIQTQTAFISLLIILLLLLIVATFLLIKAKNKVNTLFKELSHRVDNNLQILLSILQMKKHATKDPGQQAALKTIEERINAMISIHQILKEPDYNQQLLVGINKFINDLAINISSTYSNEYSHFYITTNIIADYFEGKRAVTIGLLINEVLTNIFKHGRLRGNSCEINIALQFNNGRYVLSIADDCAPWEPQPENNKGMGLSIIHTLSSQLKGKLTTESNNSGTTVNIVFKLFNIIAGYYFFHPAQYILFI